MISPSLIDRFDPFAHIAPGKVRKVEFQPARQSVGRAGLFFQKIGRWRRAVYQQYDGQVVVATECTCRVEYEPFRVVRSWERPIDQHRREAV